MPRCPSCHRRLTPGIDCPADGSVASADGAPSPSSPPEIPGYTLGEFLGSGGFADVWAARADAGGADVAIKVAHAAGDPRFGRESYALQRVGHPTTPILLSDGVAGNRPFVVMERVRGVLLGESLAASPGGRYPLPVAIPIFQSLCAATARIHAARLVHCDLKPDNVFLCPNAESLSRLVVFDFGVSAQAGTVTDPAFDTHITTSKERPGTAYYMAPEQVSPSGETIDPAVDIYALGVILFEMLCGRPPFVGELSTIKRAHLTDRPPRPSDLAGVPAHVDDVILRCLAKAPSERFSDALPIADELAPAPRAAPTAGVDAQPKRPTTQPVAMLGIDEQIGWSEVRPRVAAARGVVIRAKSPVVVAFPHLDAAAGARAAVRSAHALSAVAGRVVVHVADVRVRSKDGRVRMRGDAVSDPSSWLGERGRDVLVTRDAARHLDTDMCAPLEGSTGLFVARAPVEPPIPTAEPLPLFGRRSELDALAAQAQRATAEGPPGLRLISGDVGVGKSRLLEALGEMLEGAIVVRAAHDDSMAPLRTLAQWALSAADGVDAADRAAVEFVLGERSETDPGVAGALAAPGAIRTRVSRAIGRAIRDRTRDRPGIVLIDDAHRVDPVVLDAIDAALATDDGEVRLWVCATTAPGFAERRPTWRGRDGDIELGPLDEDHATGMIRRLLRPAEFVPGPIVAKLHSLAAGNPLLMVEIAEAVRASGALRKHRGTRAWFVSGEILDDIDDLFAGSARGTLESLAERSLRRVPADMQPLLSLCAVLGHDFERDDVAAVQSLLDRDPGPRVLTMDAGVGLQRLERARILVREDGRYRFRQPLLLEVVESKADLALRTRLYEAAYRMYSARQDASPLRLARYAAGAGHADEAVAVFFALAEDAREHHRYVTADRYYTEVLTRTTGATKLRASAFAGRCQVRYRVERFSDALEDVREAREIFESLGDRAQVAAMLLEQATNLDWSRQWQRAASATEQAAATITADDDPRLRAKLLMSEGRVLLRAAKHAEAAVRLEAASTLAKHCNEYETEVISLLLLGSQLTAIGQLERAEQVLEQAREASELAGDYVHLAAAYNNRVILWCARKEYERARRDLQTGIELARDIGNVTFEYHAEYNLAEMLIWVGNLDEALRSAERAYELCLRHDAEPIPHVGVLVGRVHVARGDPDSARPSLSWLRDNFSIDALPADIDVFRRSIELAIDGGDQQSWRQLCRDAADHGLTVNEQLEVLVAAIESLVRSGRSAAAAPLLGDARALATDDATWRARLDALSESCGA